MVQLMSVAFYTVSTLSALVVGGVQSLSCV